MSCTIVRHPKTDKIIRVNAPNGNESILYKSILESIPEKIELDNYLKEALIKGKIKNTTPEEIALGLWSKTYTSQFKERNIEKDNNGESIFTDELIKDGDFSVHSGNIYYQLTDQEINEINPNIIKHMTDLVKKLGGSIEMVDNMTDINGNPINAYGKIEALNGIIKLLNGKATPNTLVEEATHMIQALMGPNHPLMKVMMNDIVNFDVYHEVKKEYADVYETEDEFRFEAVGKMITKHIIQGEPLGNVDRATAVSWWQKLLNVLGRMFYGIKTDHIQPEIDAFQQAAEIILNQKVLEDIKPIDSSNKAIKALAEEFEMSTSGFIDGRKNLDELKIKAKNTGVEIAISENDNYYFKKDGKKLNPFVVKYQLAPKSQTEIVKDLLDTHSKVAPEKHKYIDEYGVQRETYIVEGEVVKNRVSGLQDKKFNKNKTIEEIQAADKDPKNIIFREVGTELHNINEDFMKIGVSKRNLVELTPGVKIPGIPKANSIVTDNHINVLGKSINSLLDNIEDIQASIDPNAKATIITENFVHDKVKDIAGSQDILVVFSDGSAAIYDYKFINFGKDLSKEAEIPFSKRNSYHLQISEYRRILKEVYGIKTFRETRILPFSIQYVGDKTSKATIKKQVKSLEGFDYNSSKNYLIPLPVANEITNDKKLNEILTSLFNREQLLTKKISQNWMNPEIKNPLIDELELTKKSIKAIQIKSDVEPLIKSINKTLDNLAKISKDATIESINDLVLMDAEIKLFKGIYSTASHYINKESEEKFNDISIRLVKAENVIKDKLIELLSTFHLEINIPQREMEFLASNFNTMSDINHPVFEVARKLIANSFGDTRRMMDTLLEELETKKTNLENWSKSRGISLLDAYNKIINPNTGNLKGKFSSEFHQLSKDKRKEGDSKWFKDNYEYTEAGKELYKKNLELYENSLEGNGENFKKYKLEEWKDNNDLSRDKAWLNPFTISSYTELKNPEKHYSDSYKELLQESNKPLKEFYDYYIETNKFFNSIVDDKIDVNFIANINKDLIDSIGQGDNPLNALKNMKENFINGLRVRQNDTITIEGEDNNTIPLLYKDSFSYYDSKTKEWVNGTDNKSFDLATNMALFAESVFNKHNMSKISGTIQGLKLLINNQKVIKLTESGKVEVNEETGEIQSTTSAKNTNAKVFEAQINALVYGKRIQNKDKHITIGDTTISTNKALASLMSYMSTKSLALNYVSGIGNFFGAYSNAYIKGVGGKYYTSKQMMKAHKLQFSRSDSDLYNHVKEFWNVGNPHWAKDKAMNLSLSALTKNLTYEKFYILQEKGDEFVANSILVSMMQNYGLDEKGTPTRLELLPEGTKSLFDSMKRENDKLSIEGLTDEGFDDFRRMVLYVSKQVKGTANPEDISMIQTTVWGKSLMHFKSWIAPMVKERYGDLKYTPEVKEWEFGRYRSFFSELFTKKFVPNMLKLSLDILTFGKMKYKGDIALLEEQFAKWEEANPDMKGKLTKEDYLDLRERTIRESIHELKILASMFLLILAAKGDWDDDGVADYKKNVVTKQLFKILNRSYLELSFFTNPTSFQDLVKTPIPVVQVFVDITNVGTNSVDEMGDILFGKDKQDKTPVGHYTKKLVPVANPIFNFLEDFNEDSED